MQDVLPVGPSQACEFYGGGGGGAERVAAAPALCSACISSSISRVLPGYGAETVRFVSWLLRKMDRGRAPALILGLQAPSSPIYHEAVTYPKDQRERKLINKVLQINPF